jgi:hypothetical protein
MTAWPGSGSLAVAALVLAAPLGGCAHSTRQNTPVPVRLAAPAALTPRSAEQVIRAVYGAQTITLRTAVQLDTAGLKVVGVNATGQRLFTVSWDGKTVAVDKGAFVPDAVQPGRVLADLQLAFWPLASVREMFAAQGLEVSEPFAGVRRLQRGAALVSEVHYTTADPWSGRLWLVNFEHDYSLTVDTVASN